MRKIRSVVILALAALMILTSCASPEEPSKTLYFVGDTLNPYVEQVEGFFEKPADPVLPKEKAFVGWTVEGSNGEIYRDWDVQPAGLTIMHAVMEDNILFYVGKDVWKSMPQPDVVNPGIPITKATDENRSVFIGWFAEGSEEPVSDWKNLDPEVKEYHARFVDLVHFYLNNEVWKTVRLDQFNNPGDVFGKDIPRGYEFLGWVPVNDYEPYTDWTRCPEGVRRFDALLTIKSFEDAIEGNNPVIKLNLDKDFRVLGPVTVSEKYEILDGEVKVGGIGYNDMIAAALEKYPETDQVINIVFDHERQNWETGLDSLEFETLVATGIAIDIVELPQPEKAGN